MIKKGSLTRLFFDRVVLCHPIILIVFMALLAGFLAYHVKDFRLDASSETLILNNDADLYYSRKISSDYGKRDFLALTYTRSGDLFTDQSLAEISNLRDDLEALESVSSVVSIMDVPLLQSPSLTLTELKQELPTLASRRTDRELAKLELSQGPLYSELMLSANMKTTVLWINFHGDKTYGQLRQRRDDLRKIKNSGSMSPKQNEEFKTATEQFRHYRDKTRAGRHNDIAEIRAVADKYRNDAELFLGGTGIIADDMITFIRNDLKVFGIGIVVFLVIMLGIIFGRKRWVFVPMLCCAVSVVSMVGLLGWFGWEVTVISSNFISLQIIMTLAITIHLIVCYREMLVKNPDRPNHELILDTILLKLKPCVYAVLTTIAGFASLVLSDILPIRTFGWMMIAGLVVSLVITFLLFPALLVLMVKEKPKGLRQHGFSVTKALARFTQARGNLVVIISVAALLISIAGIVRLTVENSFIDYFKKNTDMYQGMKLIDQNLGGTTSLDVIIDFEEADPVPQQTNAASSEDEGFDEFDEFAEFDDFDEAAKEDKYWFTEEKMSRVKAVHSYLDGLSETGKVLSLATMVEIAESLNEGQSLDSLDLALLYSETPDQFKEMLIQPYVSVERNQVRFWVRIRDTAKDLRRNALLNQIRSELPKVVGIDSNKIHLTAMFVLYNNMLQSLFNSQILTLGITALMLSAMFLVMFRSLKIALIAMFANLLPIAVVLGFMGWIGIPLDMMTMTIAAISLGIAVDDTIHYIHRFKSEFEKGQGYIHTMHRCHQSIGHAMYYTSITIIIGFSILALSSFVPSIYFGLLTGLAMFIAFVTALTLLPQLIIMFAPFGKET